MVNQRLSAELNRFNTTGEMIRLSKEKEVFLTLPYQSEKKIGRIVQENDEIIYEKQEEEKHIIRKNNAWSINKTVLFNVDKCRYITSHAIYEISRKDALDHGQTFNKYSHGLDDKLVVPLVYWKTIYQNSDKNKAIELFGKSWGMKLYPLISDPKFIELSKKLKEKRRETICGEQHCVLPQSSKVFEAFHLTPFEDLKLVILGSHPQVNSGLAYQKTKLASKVMEVIEKEIYDGFMLDKDSDLTKWAEQGILLLNRTLTSVLGENNHIDLGWDYFTEFVLRVIMETDDKIIFFSWEDEIKEYLDKVIEDSGLIIKHFYSPLTTIRIFERINNALAYQKFEKIEW